MTTFDMEWFLSSDQFQGFHKIKEETIHECYLFYPKIGSMTKLWGGDSLIEVERGKGKLKKKYFKKIYIKLAFLKTWAMHQYGIIS
jgi:hypothetical protein